MNSRPRNNINSNGEPVITELENAVFNANVRRASTILNEGNTRYLLSRRNAFGNPILHYAIDSGSTNMVRLLLRKGANVNKGNPEAPLTHAIKQGKMPIVRDLIDAGANVNIDNGQPLRAAAEHGRHDMVELLIQKGAHVNRKNNLGKTALYLASERGHNKIVKTLLGHGANLLSKDEWGKTPLNATYKKQHKNFVRRMSLNTSRNNDAKKNNMKTPLEERVFTPLDIRTYNMTVPIDMYNDGSVKDMDQYHPAIQSLVRRRLAIVRGTKYTPFEGIAYTTRSGNKAFTDHATTKPMSLHLHYDHGTIPLKLYRNGRIKDYHHYPPSLRSTMTTTLGKHGIDVKIPPKPIIKRKDANVRVYLRLGRAASVPVNITSNGAIRDISAKPPSMQRVVLETFSKLQKSPAWRNDGRRLGGRRNVSKLSPNRKRNTKKRKVRFDSD